MKNLIVHPKDSTTEFLSPIYAPLKNKTVITGGVTKSEIQELIEIHDRVIMLGHGSPEGLLSVNQFPDAGYLIIDVSVAGHLKNKKENIYIWCHAEKFVQTHGLVGLYTEMYISEILEADLYGFDDIDWSLIDESNERFASVMSTHINEPISILYQKLSQEYGILAKSNPIAKFNQERLYLTFSGMKILPV